LQLLNYLISESTSQSLEVFEGILQRILAPFAVTAKAVLNRTRVSVPEIEESAVPEEAEAQRVQTLRAVRDL
jgi:hypothetical protein